MKNGKQLLNNNLSPELIKFLEDVCIFFQPWWLEAVSPGQWGYSVAKRGDDIAGVLPFTYKTRLGKYRLQDLPLVFSYQGPWIKNGTAKYSRNMSEEKQIMAELINKLPDFAVFNLWLHPNVTNWLPFYWNNFMQTTRYTYIIDASKNIDEIWNGTRANIRTDIRKAQNILRIVEEEDVTRFFELEQKTFQHQGIQMPFAVEMLVRIDSECSKREARKILLADDEKGRAHAGVYLVWDNTTVYSILRGSDPQLRNSGANSLLVWKAIEYAISMNKNFDFCGSWNEPIERFILAFGARQVPFFEITRTSSKLVKVYRMVRKYI
ncbi:MAG: GNAT family N-acetyltransferase [Ignavibacteriales bacterium]|nr:GNAT family N-acetyltransferase [Ignavibacteriales bacterium]